MTNTERRTTSFWFKMRFHHWCCETSPSTKTMATRAMKAIQAKTATKTMSARAMKAKTAMKTMSTRAMKAKKAKTALKTMSKKAMKAKKAIGAGFIAFKTKEDYHKDYHAVKNAILKANKTALKTMSKKKAMQAMKAKKAGRKSLVPGGIDWALRIHEEDRHDKAPMALRTQRLHQANSPKKMTKKAMESAGTQAVSPKRFRAATAIEKPRAVKNLFPSDFEVWGDEYKDQKATTDDECIAVAKCHDDDLTQGLEETKHHDDLTQGLEETWHHNRGAKYHARTVTVPAGSVVQFLGPVQLTVHPNKPNDKEEKQEEEVVV